MVLVAGCSHVVDSDVLTLFILVNAEIEVAVGKYFVSC